MYRTIYIGCNREQIVLLGAIFLGLCVIRPVFPTPLCNGRPLLRSNCRVRGHTRQSTLPGGGVGPCALLAS